jgi:hypothetical protein
LRAGKWSTNRDIAAAYLSWERACRAADALPADDLDRAAMRIAPRVLLCDSAWRVHASISARFEELGQLCTLAGDKASLAIGMAGLVRDHMMHARVREASRLASELMVLVESIGDSTLTVGAATAAIYTKLKIGEMADVLRWSQTVIDLAQGEPIKDNLGMGSPLAAALAYRGFARCSRGRQEWQKDFSDAVAIAREVSPMAHAAIVNAKYGPAIPCGVLLPHDVTLREIDEALQIAERSAQDVAVGSARMALGVALLHRGSADRERGLELLEQVREMCLHDRFFLSEAPWVEVYIAREKARHGDRDAVAIMRKSVDELFDRGLRSDHRRPRGDAPGRGRRWGYGGSRGRDATVGRGFGRRRLASARHHAVATARAVGSGPWGVCGLSGSGRAIPRHGGVTGLRGAHRVGAGYGMTAPAAGSGTSGTELLNPKLFHDGGSLETVVATPGEAARPSGVPEAHRAS